ncbi:SMP-30/gluconolactonase/LRE family protein [Mucilaginibacter limnophilus]|uniref:SMP-30/gluconolactonase/LRE family protein n=2 Tax=Mucilaginibacter limnophilus TaxID=1932778 RepID=A0A3S2UM64_9SPHI|nr:SMP-30/gluconolactonase/LRE family protein [Mucilaginibacter limnophilus]
MQDTTYNLFEAGATPQLVSGQFIFTEGPATDKYGNVFFTDQPNNKIWKYDTDGKLSVFMDNAGRSNGLYFDKKGNLIACADEHNQLWSITPDGKVKVLVKDLDGKLLNGPNDVWITPNGDMFFTDPYYQRDYWTRKSSALDGEKLYYLAKNSSKPVVADAQFKQPNGIVGTADGKYLYVADIGDNKTYRYNIGKNGQLTNKTLLITQGSDGMTVDNLGNIYLTGKGVTIYSPEGKKITNIPIPEQWTGNVVFGGKNRDVLFITASKGIYILKMKVKGGDK